MAEIPEFELGILQHYLKKGFTVRLGLVLILLNKIKENYSNPAKDPKQETFGTNTNEKMAGLQIGVISQLMILLEDIALFCHVFLQNKTFEYYEFLDKKGEEDLGKIVGSFYQNTENLTFDEIRRIMSYGKSEDFDFLNDAEKDILELAIKNSVFWMKNFLNKVSVFYISHIGVYRRIKHASLPIQLGIDIPEEDEWYKKFDFWNLGFTSPKELADTAILIPFSKKVFTSYMNLLNDIQFCFKNTINSRLIIIERKIKGILPYKDDNFSKKLSDETVNNLKEFWERFDKKYPPTNGGEVEISMQGMRPPWYSYLDDYYSKPLFELVDDNMQKK